MKIERRFASLIFCCFTQIALAILFLMLSSVAVTAQSVDDCLICHADEELEAVTEKGKSLNLYVNKNDFLGTPHANFACVDCHNGADDWEEVPHFPKKSPALLCVNCHESEAETYVKSIHGMLFSGGDRAAATCYDCHGTHRVLPAKHKDSTINKFKLHKTCGVCHQNKEFEQKREMSIDQPVMHFVDSLHGRALLKDGLIVAPSCTDCHGSHDILPRTHPKSKIYKDNIPHTCGKCHVLVEGVYRTSVHGQLLEQDDHRGPTCISCHTSHDIGQPYAPEFRLKSDRTCGKCHMDRLKNYRDTFHGKALALGRSEVAACFDCHGHHDVHKRDDPRSTINVKNKTATCQKCHLKANRNFASYIVHADHTDKKNYPRLYYTFWFMTSLLIGTFVLFAIHSVLWLFRSIYIFYHDSKAFHKVKKEIRNDDEMFIRFNPIDRFLHILVIVSFILLVLTGMPLKFFYTSWAKHLLALMGGQAVASVLHRVAAIITIFYFLVHIASVLIGVYRKRTQFRDSTTKKFSMRLFLNYAFGPDSPMPRWQDFRDIVAHNKWFFGNGEKPQFDRWTYWEKFDYLAVFWGVAVIGLSGFIMWFPEFFTTLLPGWIINIALIIHSDEALLAAGFIFTFHFFNVHFRPEKFPIDTVIFSGRISKNELLHERKKLYDRWKQSGELELHKLKDEWNVRKWIAIPFGFIAFITGIVLVLLILFAMFSRLHG